MTGHESFDDDALAQTLSLPTSPMRSLRRFIMTDAAMTQEPSGTSLTLTSKSVIKLFECCPQLQCIGDLRHWNISPPERRQLSKVIQDKSGLKWISTTSH